MVQEIMDKEVSLSVKMHCSVSGHVTLGVVRWRHELNHACPQYTLSKFGPMQAYVRWVTANWFFPSNGLKRYFNGPLKVKIWSDRCVRKFWTKLFKKPTKCRNGTLNQSEASKFCRSPNQDRVILPSIEGKLRKNALCLNQSAFSNFALYVIIIVIPTADVFCRKRW